VEVLNTLTATESVGLLLWQR